ncbi:RNA polymerase sigma factor [Chitinophaga pinensis]|uniref:RNA polymerase, sigma-24 subunit, ECF subfamily n=1 Tax=Chitinophaga pinensis (strain ATCC 43595 / DSM 2588 / LMG 13176 / NBRC 15968 / NCIMB 11800 / UQM 2034) TaxID=485918 RepID=A0A979G7G9_CHIPD|nr:RNA polymerase sigma-70 factor [Chitinophaga pinensis]ACU62048.1 RNA polymerase, sigma-24 subunit, ECF subfamily [Chitinophaga pinensis DSM 2588]
MGIVASLTDAELADRLPHADKAAVKEVYIRYRELLLNYAKKMLGDDDLAEDTVSDVFANLLTKREAIKIDTSLQSYLYKSVKNSILNQFDKDQHRQQYINSIREFYQKGEYATDELVLERDLRRRIEDAVASFPPKMKEIFDLSRKAHLTRRQIAQATCVTEGTVNTQINRALKILRSKLTLFFIW